MNRLTNYILNIIDSENQNTKSPSYLEIEFSELTKTNKYKNGRQLFTTSMDSQEYSQYLNADNGSVEIVKRNENQNDDNSETTDEQTYRKNVTDSTQANYGPELETYEKERPVGISSSKTKK